LQVYCKNPYLVKKIHAHLDSGEDRRTRQTPIDQNGPQVTVLTGWRVTTPTGWPEVATNTDWLLTTGPGRLRSIRYVGQKTELLLTPQIHCWRHSTKLFTSLEQ